MDYKGAYNIIGVELQYLYLFNRMVLTRLPINGLDGPKRGTGLIHGVTNSGPTMAYIIDYV